MPLESKIPSEPLLLPSSVEKIPTIRLPAPLFRLKKAPLESLAPSAATSVPIVFRIPRVWTSISSASSRDPTAPFGDFLARDRPICQLVGPNGSWIDGQSLRSRHRDGGGEKAVLSERQGRHRPRCREFHGICIVVQSGEKRVLVEESGPVFLGAEGELGRGHHLPVLKLPGGHIDCSLPVIGKRNTSVGAGAGVHEGEHLELFYPSLGKHPRFAEQGSIVDELKERA